MNNKSIVCMSYDRINIGISFAKDGSVSIDMEKMKSADIETLEKLLGSKSEMVSRL